MAETRRVVQPKPDCICGHRPIHHLKITGNTACMQIGCKCRQLNQSRAEQAAEKPEEGK